MEKALQRCPVGRESWVRVIRKLCSWRFGLEQGWRGLTGRKLRNKVKEQGKAMASRGPDRVREFEKTEMPKRRSHREVRNKMEARSRGGGLLVEGPPGVRGAGLGHMQRGDIHCKVVGGKMGVAQIFRVSDPLCGNSYLLEELVWGGGGFRRLTGFKGTRWVIKKLLSRRGKVIQCPREQSWWQSIVSAEPGTPSGRGQGSQPRARRGWGAECKGESTRMGPTRAACLASADSLLCLHELLGSWMWAQVSPAPTSLYFWVYATTVSYDVSIVY